MVDWKVERGCCSLLCHTLVGQNLGLGFQGPGSTPAPDVGARSPSSLQSIPRVKLLVQVAMLCWPRLEAFRTKS